MVGDASRDKPKHNCVSRFNGLSCCVYILSVPRSVFKLIPKLIICPVAVFFPDVEFQGICYTGGAFDTRQVQDADFG